MYSVRSTVVFYCSKISIRAAATRLQHKAPRQRQTQTCRSLPPILFEPDLCKSGSHSCIHGTIDASPPIQCVLKPALGVARKITRKVRGFEYTWTFRLRVALHLFYSRYLLRLLLSCFLKISSSTEYTAVPGETMFFLLNLRTSINKIQGMRRRR